MIALVTMSVDGLVSKLSCLGHFGCALLGTRHCIICVSGIELVGRDLELGFLLTSNVSLGAFTVSLKDGHRCSMQSVFPLWGVLRKIRVVNSKVDKLTFGKRWRYVNAVII